MTIRQSKYEPLYKYLKGIDNRISLTFLEIEQILGFSLPLSAAKYMAWWDDSSQHTQAYAWTKAGYKANPNLREKKVNFVKF